jgi:D-glycero-alpha-D-manno-heptose-7-phosphate kinase
MIVVQTPLRLTFAGGGTDFPQYFMEEEGCVVSTAIDRYIFVIVKERFDDMIRVGYTQTELVENVDEVQHELVREALKTVGIQKRLEVNTMGDIPSSGSGMGSSSTLTVGLLNAMYQHLGVPRNAEDIAREACQIEIGNLGKPIGMQDQYIAAYGGQRFIRFRRDGRVEVEHLKVSQEQLRKLNERLMLFYTGIARTSASVLKEQVCNIGNCKERLGMMKALALEAKAAIESGEFDAFGDLLHRGWELKKALATKITNGPINTMYDTARKAGALGGKIAGAGGGGYLLLYCPPERQDSVRNALNGYPELRFRFEPHGTKVIFDYQRVH